MNSSDFLQFNGQSCCTSQSEVHSSTNADKTCNSAELAADAANIAFQKFIRSMQGNKALGEQQAPTQNAPFTTLPDLLPPSITISIIDTGDESLVDHLLNYVPPSLLLLSQEVENTSFVDPTPEAVAAAIEALSLDQKKDILRKVLRSPQFSQSLGSLTVALRDGGLPSIGDALGISLKNGGFMKSGGVPVGGGDAVEVFLDGVRAAVEKETDVEKGDMDTS